MKKWHSCWSNPRLFCTDYWNKEALCASKKLTKRRKFKTEERSPTRWIHHFILNKKFL
jgi:hypothetical protein